MLNIIKFAFFLIKQFLFLIIPLLFIIAILIILADEIVARIRKKIKKMKEGKKYEKRL